MKTIKVTIVNKCKRGESEKSYYYTDRVGKRKLFFIPKKGIASKQEKEDAIEFVLYLWCFKLIEEDLRNMRDYDVIMPDKG